MGCQRQLTAISLLGFAFLAGCGDGEGGAASTNGPARTAQGDLPSGAGHGAGEGNRGAAACGNGVTNPMEDCDDGNNVDGDGCSAACEIEVGYTCTGKRSLCVTVCGDGIM